VQKLHKALQKTLTDTQLRAGLFAMGQEVSPAQTLAEADKAYKDEIAAYQSIAKAIGLNPQ
jgi:tripartite-type tricarboxylate transporter receptor subunit TctC